MGEDSRENECVHSVQSKGISVVSPGNYLAGAHACHVCQVRSGFRRLKALVLASRVKGSREAQGTAWRSSTTVDVVPGTASRLACLLFVFVSAIYTASGPT